MRALGVFLGLTRGRAYATEERGRRRLAEPKREASPSARLRARHEVTSRTVGGFPVWTVRPRTPSGRAAVYLHGGAYVSGIATQHWTLIGRLADAGVRVEVPLYGLAPQHTHRDAYPFVRTVYEALAGEAPGEGIVLAGDSAGAGLALGVAREVLDAGLPRPRRVVLIAPWLDLTLSHPELDRMESERVDPWLQRPGLRAAAAAWAGGDDATIPRLSPRNGPLEGLPPLTLMVGTRDLCLPDTVDLAEAAAAAGVKVDLTVVDGALHVYPLLPVPEGAEGGRAVVAAVAG
jgi:epsilon-lactone hydrolase